MSQRINLLSWFDKSTILHLRIPFSFLLLPVFLFALSQADHINWHSTAIAFIILHLLLYPASNGYNSYQDRDETSIGGLKHPPKVTSGLFYVTLMMDITGVLCSLFISWQFAACALILVLVSRAYSYRKIRLKKFGIPGFFVVILFQGAFVYLTAATAISDVNPVSLFHLNQLICMGVAALFIGSSYPLSQVYQHEADKKDGVISLSYKLGYMGTFIFSAALFSMGTVLLLCNFQLKKQSVPSVLFLLFMVPAIVRLLVWVFKVQRSTAAITYENTMSMTILIASSMNLYFAVLIANHFLKWF